MVGYELEHSPEYDAELKIVYGDIKKADDFVKNVHLVVSRNPYKGRKSNKNVWEFQMANESVRIYYSIDEAKRKVCLLGIKRFG